MSDKKVSWNESIEKILDDTSKKCQKFRETTSMASKKFYKKYNIFMYMIIIISPISGILSSASETSSCNEACKTILSITITILSFFIGVLSAIIKFSKFDQKANALKTCSSKFGALENNIQRQLALKYDDRQDAGIYTEYIFKAFDVLCENTPFIPFNEKENNKQPDIVQNNTEKNNIESFQFSDPYMKYEITRFMKA